MPPPAEAFTGVLAVTLCGADGGCAAVFTFQAAAGGRAGASCGPPYMGGTFPDCAKILRG